MTGLGALSSPDVAQLSAQGALLVVPLGSTEQHGPHLPLSTDTDIAVALCERFAAGRAGMLVAPAVAYGSSGEHAGFAGTLSIGQAALELLVIELCRSATDTFDHVLLVSGHGGNAEPLARAVATLRSEGRDVHAWSPQWEGDPHAGRPETSMQLSLHPDLVAMQRAEPGDQRSLSATLTLLRSGGVRAVSANGVLGDPTGATAAEGAAQLTALTADLAASVARWLNEA